MLDIEEAKYFEKQETITEIFILGKIPDEIDEIILAGVISLTIKCGEDTISSTLDEFDIVLEKGLEHVEITWAGTTDTYCESNDCTTEYGVFP